MYHALRSVGSVVLMRSHSEVAFVTFVYVVAVLLLNVLPAKCAPHEHMDECGHTLKRPSSFFKRHFDFPFMKKFFKHWIPFMSSARVKMHFYLYKRDFPECGREIRVDDDETLEVSQFNAEHPTRIIIHGWMSQSKGSFNRAVKNAYLSLARPARPNATAIDNESALSAEEKQQSHEAAAATTAADDIDYNVIVVDWSVISSNVNYFGVVDLIEDLGFLLAEFVRHLHMRVQLQFDKVYLIGHSLGAQIAGSAGKQIKPFKFNTIFALDPAGPKFRDLTDEFRIDPSDASYVESIHTSSTLGFREPVGHATFYPNYGKDQKKCYFYGCSHSRAYDYFTESITSQRGFWGTLCQREANDVWILSDSGAEFRMGGEPSTPKHGTFYVKTNDKPPYALGKRTPVTMEEMVALSSNKEANIIYLA